MPDSLHAPAHCATLVARIIKGACADVLTRPAAWYGPSTLYLDTLSTCAVVGGRAQAGNQSKRNTAHSTTTNTRRKFFHLDDTDVQHTSDTWNAETSSTKYYAPFRLSDEQLREFGEDELRTHLTALTNRVLVLLAENDQVAYETAQRQLATALLRWAFVRNP